MIQGLTRLCIVYLDKQSMSYGINGSFIQVTHVWIISIIVSMVYILNKDVLLSFFDIDSELIGIIYLPVLFIALFRIYQTVFENISANYRRIAANNFIREIVNRLLLLLLSFFKCHTLPWVPWITERSRVICLFIIRLHKRR